MKGAPNNAGRLPTTVESSDVFVSYSRQDKDFVLRLNEHLVNSGRQGWIDWKDIPPTLKWLETIFLAIEAAHAFVFVVSPSSISSTICLQELEHALSQNKKIVPILYREVEAGIPAELASRNWISFRGRDDFAEAFKVLLEALDTDFDYVHSHTRLLIRSREWESKGHDQSLLLRGTDLLEAERWLEQSGSKKEPHATETQTKYIFDSRRNAVKRRRIILGAVVAGLVISTGLAIAAFFQYQASRSRELAAKAMAQLSVDPERGVLLSIEAIKAARTVEAEESLRQALQESHVRFALPCGGGPMEVVKVSPDGKLVLTFGHKTACLSEVETGRVAAKFQLKPDEYQKGDEHLVNVSFTQAGVLLLKNNAADIAEVWELGPNKKVVDLKGSYGYVRDASFSPDGKLVITSGMDGTIRVWDKETGEDRQELHVGPGEEEAADYPLYGPDGKSVMATLGGAPWFWDFQKGKTEFDLTPFKGHYFSSKDGPVSLYTKVSSNPDFTLVVAPVGDVAGIWKTGSGRSIGRLEPHAGKVQSASFSPNGKLIITTESDGSAIWDAKTEQAIHPLKGHEGAVLNASFSADGKFVVTAGADHTARVWDVESGRAITVLRGHSDAVMDASFTPNGMYVVTTSADGTARMWDAGTGMALSAETEYIGNASFSPDGSLVAAGGNDGTVRLWDAANGSLVRSFSLLGAGCLAFSPDGGVIAAGGADLIELWDVRTGRRIKVLERNHPTELTTDIDSIAFSPDGKYLITSGPGGPWGWNTGTGSSFRDPLHSFLDTATRQVFSPDSKFAVVATEEGVHLWNLDLQRSVATFSTGAAGDARFSPDGKLIAIAAGSNVQILERTTRVKVKTLEGHIRAISYSVFSPDNKLLATVSDDVIRVWECSTWRNITDIRGLGGSIGTVQFSSNSKFILTGGFDETVRIWNALTGREIFEVPGSYGVFSPNGKSVAVPGGNQARIYQCETCDSLENLLILAQKRLTRSLTEAEKRDFLQ